MKSFWDELPTPILALAPMEAVTDVVFRHVVKAAAPPDIYFTEFTNATGWVHAGEKAIGGRLFKTDDEDKLIAQIWGGEPGDMAALAEHCKKLGYKAIDINMGCPAKSAVKSGGSALIKNPQLAAESIAAAKTAGLPVSVKTRLGYSSLDEWKEWLGFLLKQDIVALTVHLRTKREMSKVSAHTELIPDIKALRDAVAPSTKLLVNGDVMDREHALSIISETGIDGVMIGRGIFHNPFAFEIEKRTHSRDELLELLKLQLDLYERYSSTTGRPFETLKRFFKIYIRDFDGASELRNTLMQCRSVTDVRKALDGE